MSIRDLLARHLAGDELEGEELEAVIVEYERLAEVEERRQIAFANGRKTAGNLRKAKGEQTRAVWMAEAMAVQREMRDKSQKPVSLKALALSVYERCSERGMPHNSATIYNFLTAESEQLRAALESSTTQANAVGEAPTAGV